MFLVAMALPACGLLSGPNNAATPVPPTVTPLLTATSAPASPTSAVIPTATPPSATAMPANPTSSPVVIVVTATPSLPTPNGDGACSYKATFLGDVTVPDNTVVPAGTPFVKTWRVRNDGTCTWGTAGHGLHSLVFVGGVQLTAPNPVPLPAAEVQTGGVVDISVPMVAPTIQGLYRSEWMLQVDDGSRIGVGPNGSTPLYAQIIAGPPSTGAGVTRITFAPGATEAGVEGSLPSGQSQDFAVRAVQGQTMMLDLSSSSNSATLTVWGAQGINPQVFRTTPNGWIGLLPATEDYIIRVSAGIAATNFSLNVTIPQRIVFEPGAVGKTVNGTTSARQTVTFLLRASAGQTMTVTLSAPPNSAGLTIYGLSDGNPLVRAVSGATTWTGPLPGTEDYVIEVVPAVDGAINFSLQVGVQ
jgi:Ig-like domain-containing protein